MNEDEKREKKNEKCDRMMNFLGTLNGLLFGVNLKKNIWRSNEMVLFNKIEFSPSLSESTRSFLRKKFSHE